VYILLGQELRRISIGTFGINRREANPGETVYTVCSTSYLVGTNKQSKLDATTLYD
jgi:hypothetical protein